MCCVSQCSGVKDSCELIADETFGPVLPLLPFDSYVAAQSLPARMIHGSICRSVDELITRVNSTPFGLQGESWLASFHSFAHSLIVIRSAQLVCSRTRWPLRVACSTRCTLALSLSMPVRARFLALCLTN